MEFSFSLSECLLIAVLPGKVRSSYLCLILSGNAVNRIGKKLRLDTEMERKACLDQKNG